MLDDYVDWVVLTWFVSSFLRLFRFLLIHLTLSTCFDDYDERALKSSDHSLQSFINTYLLRLYTSVVSSTFHELHLSVLTLRLIELSLRQSV
jgi:hypothetical protein